MSQKINKNKLNCEEKNLYDKIASKLKHSNCDKTQKFELLQKLKNSYCNKTQNLNE